LPSITPTRLNNLEGGSTNNTRTHSVRPTSKDLSNVHYHSDSYEILEKNSKNIAVINEYKGHIVNIKKQKSNAATLHRKSDVSDNNLNIINQNSLRCTNTYLKYIEIYSFIIFLYIKQYIL